MGNEFPRNVEGYNLPVILHSSAGVNQNQTVGVADNSHIGELLGFSVYGWVPALVDIRLLKCRLMFLSYNMFDDYLDKLLVSGSNYSFHSRISTADQDSSGNFAETFRMKMPYESLCSITITNTSPDWIWLEVVGYFRYGG